MPRILPVAAAPLALACLLVGVAAPVAPADGRTECVTTSRELDMPQESTPWPDNWTFRTTVCAQRSGSTVTAYATLKWTAPRVLAHQVYTFDGASIDVGIARTAKSRRLISRAYDVHARLEKGSGTYTTGRVSHQVGAGRAVGQAALHLNWNNDGRGTETMPVRASPSV